MSEIVVITGATGMIGRQVAALLIEAGHQVRSLSRSSKPHPVTGVETYTWNPDKGQIDASALEDATVLMHLAGENIAGGRWTEERRKLIWDSRVQTAAVLAKAMEEGNHKIHSVIGASAIGYYAHRRYPIDETIEAGHDFPAKVCQAWEAAEASLAQGRRLVTLRIGIVLSREGGAFPRLVAPIRYGVGTWLGNGNQIMSWIHVRDLAGLFVHAVQNKDMEGVYNAVAREPCSQRFFLKQTAKYLKRPLWPIGVPAFILKLVLGEMADLVLLGDTVISSRLPQTGYTFRYPHLYEALKDLCRRKRDAGTGTKAQKPAL